MLGWFGCTFRSSLGFVEGQVVFGLWFWLGFRSVSGSDLVSVVREVTVKSRVSLVGPRASLVQDVTCETTWLHPQLNLPANPA